MCTLRNKITNPDRHPLSGAVLNDACKDYSRGTFTMLGQRNLGGVPSGAACLQAPVKWPVLVTLECPERPIYKLPQLGMLGKVLNF